MIDFSQVSEKAKRLIFERDHNFKSFGALYNWDKFQTSYRIRKLMKDEDFKAEFGTKTGDLNDTQKNLLYLQFGEPKCN